MKILETQYKGGYQVKEGGNYLGTYQQWFEKSRG
jgi:hypothetical protein